MEDLLGEIDPRKAYVLPVALAPESIVHGLPSSQEILKLPGVQVIPSDDVEPGPTADVYAFTRETVQTRQRVVS